MKILFINPPHIYNNGEQPNLIFPLGLAYLSAAIKNNQDHFSLYDCVIESPKPKKYTKKLYTIGYNKQLIINKINKFLPDIVLISCPFSNQQNIIIKLCTMIKKYLPKTKIILGGNHASSMPIIFLNTKKINYIIRGEGEKVLPHLITSIKTNKKLRNIAGIIYLKNKKIINNENKKIQNLDDIKFPDWGFFDIEKYIKSSFKHSMIKTKRTMEVITSRGCNVGCDFCASNIIFGKKWTARSIDNVIREIKKLKKKYNIEEIHFVDDDISQDIIRFIELCKKLKQIKITWSIPNGIRLNILNKKLIKIMKDSGCNSIFLPFDDYDYKKTKKKFNLPKIIKVIKFAKEINIYLVGFIIIGFYIDTKNSIFKKIKFVSSLNLNEIHISIITPIPGTKYYNKYAKKINDFNTLSAKNANLNTKFIKTKEIKLLRNFGYLYFEFINIITNPLSLFTYNQLNKYKRYYNNLIGKKYSMIFK
jgi:anaerobic magnesium-protoporphyrin IX monomethyl ester cyclase